MLAAISTNIALSEEEIIRIYGKRWDIEVFFKIDKSFLKLAKEFQCRSYDSMVAHTSIVFARYIMLAMAERENKDDTTVGGIFFDCCDELKEIDFAKSISLLINLLKNILKKVKEISNEIVDSVVTNFINSTSIYISMVSRAFLPAKVELSYSALCLTGLEKLICFQIYLPFSQLLAGVTSSLNCAQFGENKRRGCMRICVFLTLLSVTIVLGN